MRLSELIFSAVLNMASIYADFKVIQLFLEKKKKTSIPPIAVYACVWGIHWGLYIGLNDYNVNMLSLTILSLTAVILLYQGSMIKKCAAVFSAMIMGILMEELVWQLLCRFQVENREKFGGFLFIVIYIIVVFILNRIVKFNKENLFSIRSYLHIFVIIIGSLFIEEIISLTGAKSNDSILIILSILCLMVLNTFGLYDKIVEVYTEKAEKRAIEDRILMYENQIQLMEQSQKEIQSFRHDMKNHMLLLQLYLKDGKYQEASDYIRELSEIELEFGQFVHSGNGELDAILNYMLFRAKNLKCRVELNVEVPETAFMSNVDLNILLGNLLDNALEALEKVREEQRYLYIGMKYQKGIFVMRIYNSYNGNVSKERGRLISQKEEKERHGFGLKNISEIVEKYDGEYQTGTTDRRFKTDILMYVK